MTSERSVTIKTHIVSAFILSLVPRVAWLLLATQCLHAQTFSVLYNFTGANGDGGGPAAGLVQDAAGNFYGTTSGGGGTTKCGKCGTVYKLDTAGNETVLHSFGEIGDGAIPEAGLILDASGNLYGTTLYGGSSNFGTVFKVDAKGKETVLYSFTGGVDGEQPFADLIRDAAGNLYGTTWGGGTSTTCYGVGCGTVFMVDATGKETVLHSFDGGADGANPTAGLVQDSSGNLYGTTENGGASNLGTVFKMDTTGTETVLYSFLGGADGAYPDAGLVRDAEGNLYGTTLYGGGSISCIADTCGTVFKLDITGAETVVHAFNQVDGWNPQAALIRDAAGDLYGTTRQGGLIPGGTLLGAGTVFEVDTTGTETVLYTFTGNINTDPRSPIGALVLDTAGNLYSTTPAGGTFGAGIVFKITPGQFTTATTLTSSLNPSAHGQAITWTATVTTSGPVAPTGTVNFKRGPDRMGTGTLNASGVATFTTSILKPGPYKITAVYKGDASNLSSTSAVLHQGVKH